MKGKKLEERALCTRMPSHEFDVRLLQQSSFHCCLFLKENKRRDLHLLVGDIVGQTPLRQITGGVKNVIYK